MRKLFIIILLIFTTLTGCKKKDDPAIFFSGKEIIREKVSIDDISIDFKVGQKIYFIVFNPLPFNDNVLKIQILKLTHNPPLITPSIAQTYEIEINKANNYFTSSFVLHKSGYYLLNVYEKNNLNEPLVRGDFKVN